MIDETALVHIVCRIRLAKGRTPLSAEVRGALLLL